MNCVTCGKELPAKPKGQRGRQRKYCDRDCNPYIPKPKGAGLTHCQVCGKSLLNIGTPGRPKRNCSNECRREQTARNRKSRNQVQKQCAVCGTAFQTGNQKHRFCSKNCRLYFAGEESKRKWREQQQQKFPDGTKTVVCEWCGKDRTFKIGESSVNAYHPDCRAEAQRARYRIKTVKRQSKTKVWRISPEQVVKEYGETCHICTKPIDIALKRTHRFGLTVDHLVPLSRGGTDDMSNLRPAHWICNVHKSDKLMEELDAQSWQKR